MSGNSKVNNNYLLYFFLVVLTLTTFPLARAWIVIGDFIPRAFLLIVVAVLYSKLYIKTDFLFVVVYFLYVIIATLGANMAGVLANFMEFAVPLVIAHYIIDARDDKAAVIVAKFAIILTTITMVLTIIADFGSPGIVRQMVAFTVSGDMAQANMYGRMGVCNYSFALIAMWMAPVYIYMTNRKGGEKLYILLFLLTLYFVFISGVTTCLILLVFMTAVALLMRRRKDSSGLLPTIVFVAILTLLFGAALVELAAPLFAGTDFESHFDGLLEFFGKKTSSSNAYNVEGRVDLYKDSIETFLSHPIFGDVNGENGGHNYFLDRFASYGIIGCIPLFALIYNRFQEALSFISPKARTTYTICIVGFFALGFLKNMSGIDYWTYMFVYIPCILRWQTIKETNTNAKI